MMTLRVNGVAYRSRQCKHVTVKAEHLEVRLVMALEVFLNSDRNDDIRSEAAAFMSFFRAGGATCVSTEEAQDVEDGTDEYVEIVAFKGSSIRSRRRARLGLTIKVHNVWVLGRGAGQRPPLCAKMRLSLPGTTRSCTRIVNRRDGVPASFYQMTCELSEILLASKLGAECLVERSSKSFNAKSLPWASLAGLKLEA